jgi:hypothetical protein
LLLFKAFCGLIHSDVMIRAIPSVLPAYFEAYVSITYIGVVSSWTKR